MAALKQQATVFCLLVLMLCASAHPHHYGGYYGGHQRRLSGLPTMTGLGRQLLSGYYYGHRHLLTSYYYGSHHRRLQDNSPVFVRPLFDNSFMPMAQHTVVADIPVPQFFTRQLQTKGGYYYGGHHRRLQSTGGYYYGSHH